MFVDIRLKTNPNLEVVQGNAADSDVQAMEDSNHHNFSEVHGEADSPADHDTADQECFNSTSSGLMVTEPESIPSEPMPVLLEYLAISSLFAPSMRPRYASSSIHH